MKYFEDCRKKMADIKREAKLLDQKRRGHVRLACLEGWDISGFFPDLLSLFSRNYPNLKIGLECYGVRGLIQALKADKVDAILTLDVTLENVEGIHTKVLTEIPRIILYSSTHPLAQKPDLKPMDFSEETFLVMGMEEVSYAGDLVRDYCRYYGFVPRIQYVRGIESMNACVQNGMGVAISDDWSSVKDSAALHYLKLDTKHKVSLAWLENTRKEEIFVIANEMKFLLNRAGVPISQRSVPTDPGNQ